jgi:large subunit ribosomal protein L7/L12
VTRADVIAYLESLDAHALGDLIDELQRRLGLPSPSQPRPFTMGAPFATMGVPEPNIHAVVVLGYTVTKKLALLQLVRELRPIGVLEAKHLLESAPFTLKECDSNREAERLAERLLAAGAQVEIRR